MLLPWVGGVRWPLRAGMGRPIGGLYLAGLTTRAPTQNLMAPRALPPGVYTATVPTAAIGADVTGQGNKTSAGGGLGAVAPAVRLRPTLSPTQELDHTSDRASDRASDTSGFDSAFSG